MEQKSTYAGLKAQIDKLQAEANELLQTERVEVISRIKEAITVYALSAKDLGFGKQRRKVSKVKISKPATGTAAPKQPKPRSKKYSDGTGNEWDGKGEQPDWVKQAIESGRSLIELATKPVRRPKKA